MFDYTFSFVAKFDLSGTHQWTTTLNFIGDKGLAADEDGNVYAGTGDFVKLDSSGALVWSRSLSSSFAGMECDGDALVYAGGLSGATLGFGVVARLPLDGSGTGSYVFDFLSDTATVDYTTASIATTADTVTVGTYSTTYSTATATSPFTPDGSTDAGQVRTIATV